MSEHILSLHVTANEFGNKRWQAICSCGWIRGGTHRKEATARKAWEYHVARHRAPCPTPGKQRFRSQAKAEAAMQKFWQTAGKGKPMPTRVYQCDCRGWHTTSKPLRRFGEAS